jgi:predicted RNA methylase
LPQEPDWLPDLSQADVSDQFRIILKASGYADSGIQEVLDPSLGEPLLPDDSAPATPLNTLLRLFFIGNSVSAKDAAQALQPLTVEQMTRARFLGGDDDRVSSLIRVEPHKDLLMARPRDIDHEHKIMAISPATLELANFVIRRHAGKALDVGTGSGLQALLTASHSDQVFAVDINPRAVPTAEFNARWNGFRNVNCRLGSLFEPVSGELFDLIVSNPPFVVSPGLRYQYRDSGIAGDKFALGFARQAPAYLNEGGFFQMMLQWIETGTESWRDKLTSCFADLGCDIWVLRTETETPEAYVAGWVRAYAEKDSDVSPTEWLRYLESLGVRCIGTGLVTMQRRSGARNHIWFDEAPADRSQPYGVAVESTFAVRKHMEGKPESALLDERVLASPSLRMIQKSQVEGTNWCPAACEFELQAGLRYCFDNVDAVLALMVAKCDGRRTLREVVTELADKNKAQPESLIEQHLGQLRELVWYGFLELPAIAPKLAEEAPRARIAAD